MKGFYNRILQINVSDQSYYVQPIDETILKTYLGSKGLSNYLLLKHNPPGVEPLNPENHLILATGPVSGASKWGSCRYGMFTKSPQTDFYSESYSGGTAGDYMTRAGYDAIIIRGSSENPIWLEINENGV